MDQNSFTEGFIYRLEISADVSLAIMKRHFACAAARQPAVIRRDLLRQHVGCLVTITIPVVSPFSTQFTGILKQWGKPEKNRFQLVDPDDASDVYLRFDGCDLLCIEEREAGLTFLLRKHPRRPYLPSKLQGDKVIA